MKHSELVVGRDYYVDGSPNWQGYGPYEHRRYTLVSLDRFEHRKYYYPESSSATITTSEGETFKLSGARPSDKGNRVLMKNVYGAIEPVPMSAIRGEFEAASALIREKARERQESFGRAERERLEAAARLNKVVEVLGEIGIVVRRDARVDGFLSMSVDEAEKLASAVRDAQAFSQVRELHTPLALGKDEKQVCEHCYTLSRDLAGADDKRFGELDSNLFDWPCETARVVSHA